MAILYTGTDPERYGKDVIHCPLIEIVPRKMDARLRAVLDDLDQYTHYIFTSKNAAHLFASHVKGGVVIAVGQGTAKRLHDFGLAPITPRDERQEGIIEILDLMDLSGAYLCLPCSDGARPLLGEYLIKRCVRHQLCPIYTTRTKKPENLPKMSQIEEIVFTSPSTIKGFLDIFSSIPKNKKLTTIGPVTEQALNGVLHGQ